MLLHTHTHTYMYTHAHIQLNTCVCSGKFLNTYSYTYTYSIPALGSGSVQRAMRTHKELTASAGSTLRCGAELEERAPQRHEGPEALYCTRVKNHGTCNYMAYSEKNTRGSQSVLLLVPYCVA